MPIFLLKFLFFSLQPEFSPVPAGVKAEDVRSQINTSQVWGNVAFFFLFLFFSAIGIAVRTSGLTFSLKLLRAEFCFHPHAPRNCPRRGSWAAAGQSQPCGSGHTEAFPLPELERKKETGGGKHLVCLVFNSWSLAEARSWPTAGLALRCSSFRSPSPCVAPLIS